MKLGQCYLCEKECLLIKKSHILPEWMYHGLFDSNHKTVLINLDSRQSKRPSTGIYDQFKYCAKCDNEIFSALETYGKKVLGSSNGGFRNFQELQSTNERSMKSFQLQVEDYTTFKLFLLSLLYRMHVSKHEFFSQVDLEDDYKEEIRRAILTREKIPGEKFEVAIIGISDQELITKMINPPRRIKQNRNSYYVMLINGLFFMFNISALDKMELITKSALRENGLMIIPILENDLAKIFYDSVMRQKIRRRTPE